MLNFLSNFKTGLRHFSQKIRQPSILVYGSNYQNLEFLKQLQEKKIEFTLVIPPEKYQKGDKKFDALVNEALEKNPSVCFNTIRSLDKDNHGGMIVEFEKPQSQNNFQIVVGDIDLTSNKPFSNNRF